MKYEFNETIRIPVNGKYFAGSLAIPEKASSLVLFSHGSGSSRFSPRNNFVADILQKEGIGTFLFDLLTSEEDKDYRMRFDIDLLTKRLVDVTKYISQFVWMKNYKIGYFGASTGAASALKAAAALPELVQAVVSRGGRPDMALEQLEKVKAPTLLIVGELDYEVINLNRAAYTKLRSAKKVEIVKGATHLFVEPDTLDEVARLAADWFVTYLVNSKSEKKNIHV